MEGRGSMTPEYTFIVPVYNTAPYLSACLDSLLVQNGDFEILAINDGSTDESPAILEEYKKKDSRIRVISQENQGLGEVRNRGINNAKGEWLIFVDSDDYLAEQALEIITEKRKQLTSTHDILLFPFVYVKEERLIFESGFARVVQGCNHRVERFSLVPVTICGKVFHRDLFRDRKVVFPRKQYYEDVAAFFSWMTGVERIVPIQEPLYYYRQHSGTITSDCQGEKLMEIVPAMEFSIAGLKKRGLNEKYEKLQEYYAILHILTEFIPRMLQNHVEMKYIAKAWHYMEKRFPQYRSNPYLCRMSPRNRLYYELVQRRKFRMLRGWMKMKESVKNSMETMGLYRLVQWYRDQATN
ncbi:MAG: glycosyltransferase family 2 protein [Lachnospiraceae bacterium]